MDKQVDSNFKKKEKKPQTAAQIERNRKLVEAQGGKLYTSENNPGTIKKEAKEYFTELAKKSIQMNGQRKYDMAFVATLRDRLLEYIEDQQMKHRPVTIAGAILATKLNPETWNKMKNGERDHLLFEFMTAYNIPYEFEGESVYIDDLGELFDVNGNHYDFGGTQCDSLHDYIEYNSDILPALRRNVNHQGYKLLHVGDNYNGKTLELYDIIREIALFRFSDVINRLYLHIQSTLEGNLYSNKGNQIGSIFALKAKHGWIEEENAQKVTNNNTLVLNNVASLDEAREALKRLSD